MTPSQLGKAGRIGVVTGAAGAAAAGIMLAWPAQSDRSLLIHPFTRNGFFVAQSLFFVHHIGLVITVVALARSGAVGSGKIVRGGAWLAVLGMTALTLAELNTMRYVDWDFEKANASAMGATYGVACNAIGVGMVIAAVGVVRARVWSGWRRWVPLAIGIATFVELTPGMFGGFVIARLAIGFWIVMFGVLGQALRAEARRVQAALD
jgi:hypothetical protein